MCHIRLEIVINAKALLPLIGCTHFWHDIGAVLALLWPINGADTSLSDHLSKQTE